VRGALSGVAEVVVAGEAGVAHEAEVEAVPLRGNLLAGVGAPAFVVHGGAVRGSIGAHEPVKVSPRERMGLAKAGHVGAQVVEPDLLRAALVTAAAREEEHVRLDALRVENARGQAQDGVQAAFVHEVAADGGAVALGKEHVIREHDGGAGVAVRAQAAVDVLEEVELFVAGLVGEVVAGGALAALFRAKGRVREHDVVARELFAKVREGVAEVDRPLDAVQHGVHEGEAVRVVYELTAGEGLLRLEPRLLHAEVAVVVSLTAHVLVRRNHKAEGAAGWVYQDVIFDTKPICTISPETA